jgi:transposase
MMFAEPQAPSTIGSGMTTSEETRMVGREVWEAIRRMAQQDGLGVSELARRFELDRKTVRRVLREVAWRPYQRLARTDTLLAEHTAFLTERAPQVDYSARILYQELTRQRGFRGSYDTVKRFVAPLRAVRRQAERALIRFETPPGWQSQIDWGVAQVWFRDRPVRQHLFVLTLGYSRRSFYAAYPDERLAQFLDAHEQAFAHFGGHTREHLYDRPRTVCQPDGDGKVRWNRTFKAFADYWGFEPRLCQAYRAQTKGKVESGVKYLKHNFLPGRAFIDQADFDAQLADWTATTADLRLHGTTHERPLDRFARERPALIATTGQTPFRLAVRHSRRVAEDYLVSFQTNRYSVPFPLIGQTVEVEPRADLVRIYHRGALVATHPLLTGTHQLAIQPAHGPGALPRNVRRLVSTPSPGAPRAAVLPEVEVRDLAVYERLAAEVAP